MMYDLSVDGKLETFLDDTRDQLTQLIIDLVSIDSQIPPYSDERKIAAFLSETISGLGLGDTEVIAAAPDRPNLITRVRGSGGGPTLMLNGHLDTKPVGDARVLWRSDPLVPELRDGRLYGLGTSDMKGAVAAMVFAAAALRYTGAPLGGDVVLAFTADEEAGSSFGAQYLAPRLTGIDACLIGEPCGIDNDWQGVCLVSRGVCGFRIRVRGTQTHSSLSDRMPSVNASLVMAELLLAIKTELELEFTPHPYGGVTPTLNPGVLVDGGVYFGVVPGLAEFACDLRTLPGMDEAGVRRSVDRWLDGRRRADPALDVEVEFEPGLTWVPPAELAAVHPLVAAACESVYGVLGRTPPLAVFPGGTDAPWYERAGIPTLPSLGPGWLSCCHGPNEFVTLEAVHDAARVYARTAARYCRPRDTGS
jgi:acetylornithine deacetylase/succinyl-diaminopimelate desuccinylase-like protein